MYYKKGSFGILNSEDEYVYPFLMLDGGIESRFNEEYNYSNRDRDEYNGYLLQYTLSGEGVFEKEGRSYRIAKNQGFLVSLPQNSRYYLASEAKEPWEFFYLHFDGSGVAYCFEKLEQITDGTFSLNSENEFVSEFLKLHTRLLEGKYLKGYEGGDMVYHLLCILLREIEQPNNVHGISLIQKAQNIMEMEYATIVSVEEIAGRLGVSFSHFTRKYREQTGNTPIQYLTKLRIQASLHYLLNSSMNIKEIAIKIGFSNGNYFSKVFLKHVGMTPNEYRSRRL